MTTSLKHNGFTLTSVGIDIGKDVFHLVGFNSDGGDHPLGRSIWPLRPSLFVLRLTISATPPPSGWPAPAVPMSKIS